MADSDTNTIETPEWAQNMQDAIEARLIDLHTSMPAEIISYDKNTGFAQVQPLLKRKFKNGDIVDLPVINNVPVGFPRTRTAFIHFPLKEGDPGVLLFSERSIDKYKTLGGSQFPDDVRKHALSDPFFLLGGYPETIPAIGVVEDALHLKNIASELILHEDGKIEMRNTKGELVDLEFQHLESDEKHTHGTIFGPTTVPINILEYTAIKNLLSAMRKTSVI